LIFTGIALGSIAALVIYHGMRLLGSRSANLAADGSQRVGESPITSADEGDNNAGSDQKKGCV
jgi:hypothetical protein